MTEQLRQASFTADEFIAWAMEQPTGRFELANGKIVAMAPERVGHARAKLAAVLALRASIERAGLGCEAMIDGVAVRIDDRTVYEPDALVRCGAPTPGDDVHVSDPIILVEVLSPSSRGIDTGLKLAGYFRLPSVRHYLVVSTETRTVLHHRRDEAGTIEVRILGEGRLMLDPPGLAIDIGDLFPGV